MVLLSSVMKKTSVICDSISNIQKYAELEPKGKMRKILDGKISDQGWEFFKLTQKI